MDKIVKEKLINLVKPKGATCNILDISFANELLDTPLYFYSYSLCETCGELRKECISSGREQMYKLSVKLLYKEDKSKLFEILLMEL